MCYVVPVYMVERFTELVPEERYFALGEAEVLLDVRKEVPASDELHDEVYTLISYFRDDIEEASNVGMTDLPENLDFVGVCFRTSLADGSASPRGEGISVVIFVLFVLRLDPDCLACHLETSSFMICKVDVGKHSGP